VLKPFSDERFFTALDRAKRRVRERRPGDGGAHPAPPGTPDAGAQGPQPLNRLAIRDGERTVVISAREIAWIEAEDYYVLVHSTRGRHMLRATLASLEERLDRQQFLRVHRAALVNLEQVREVHDDGRLLLLLANGDRIPVSRARRKAVEAAVRGKGRRGTFR
jgi:two-component system LytT family response regulator